MSNEIYTDFERPPGCTCTHGTKDNPVFGGYARCSIHAPWANKSEIDLPQQFHPLTCGGPASAGDLCERRNGTGEGELIDQGDYFVCPCGKYRQDKILSSKHIFIQKPEFQPDSIVQSVIQKFKDRAQMGEKKYDGANLDREDLPFEAWIEHAQQELMDGILYLEKLKKTSNGQKTTN